MLNSAPAWLITTTPPEHEALSKSLPSRIHSDWGIAPQRETKRRPSKVTPEVLQRMYELDQVMTRKEVAKELKLAPCTVTRLLGWKHEVKRTRVGIRKQTQDLTVSQRKSQA